MATLSPATLISATSTTAVSGASTRKTNNRVTYITGMSSFGGLKAHNRIVSLGFPIGTEQSFANFATSLKGKNGGGGVFTSRCSAVEEIFRIAAIMNGLTLVGVAVGFVLLRIEAAVEEAE